MPSIGSFPALFVTFQTAANNSSIVPVELSSHSWELAFVRSTVSAAAAAAADAQICIDGKMIGSVCMCLHRQTTRRPRQDCLTILLGEERHKK